MAAPTQYSPAFGKDWKRFVWWTNDEVIRRQAPANFFTMRQSGRGPIAIGKTYIFSMKVKGSKVDEGTVDIYYRGYKKLSEAKIERGDRGSANVRRNEAIQDKVELIPFSAGPQWTEVKKEFTLKFENKDLADIAQVTEWGTKISWTLSPASGNLYIDEVKIIEK